MIAEKRPKISIVTICFNSRNEIEDTIKSVINQTYHNKEYIIIDGNSTDGTKAILEEYKGSFSYYISESDDGVFYAMNKGLAKATGDWIIFMNAGDTFFNRKVLQEVSTYLNYDLSMVYGNTEYRRKNSKRVEEAFPPKYIEINAPTSHQSFLVKTKYAKQIGFDTQYKYASDFNMIYKIYKEYGINSVKHIPVTISSYEAIEGLTMKHQNEVFHEVLRIKDWSWGKAYGYIRYFAKKIIGRK